MYLKKSTERESFEGDKSIVGRVGYWKKNPIIISNLINSEQEAMGLDALFENQLGHWPKFQQLHMHSISTQRGRSWPYFSSMGSGFWDTGKLPYLGMNLHGHQPKFQKLHINRFSTPGGSKLSLFSLYGQWFPRYLPIFKIIIFGHETWPLAKVPEVAHIPSVYPNGGEIELIFALWAAVCEI